MDVSKSNTTIKHARKKYYIPAGRKTRYRFYSTDGVRDIGEMLPLYTKKYNAQRMAIDGKVYTVIIEEVGK